jgi:hypothetical protein
VGRDAHRGLVGGVRVYVRTLHTACEGCGCAHLETKDTALNEGGGASGEYLLVRGWAARRAASAKASQCKWGIQLCPSGSG